MTMADRHTLSVNKIDDFKQWLVNNGWLLQETKGVYEVLRAYKQGRGCPMIIYGRDTTNGNAQLVHFTVLDSDMPVVKQYLRCKKERANEQSRSN